jgi:L-asparaginase II
VDPIRVTVQRGRVTESVHHVHVRTTDEIAYGDDVFCFLRSSAKPIQAIPLFEAYDDLTDEELAIACASHNALPEQIAAVRVLLARAGATVDDLECGPQEGRPEGKLGHNCSGKHAGMLAACRANGWPFEDYRLASHPLQQRIAELIGGEDTAIDGCGVPTFAMPLSEAAALLLRTPARIADAMRARPELISWERGNDAQLMRLRPGWIAKGGAEGLFCAASPDGVGVALKVEDGAGRAIRPALGVVLGIEEFGPVELRNSRGEAVGEISARA